MLYYEPYKIGHWAGFKDLTELHNEWLSSFLYTEEDQTLLAHRGSYKTTALSLFLAIHTVIRPNENVLLLRKTDTDVTEVIRQVSKILQSPVMQKIIRGIYETGLQMVRDTGSEIHTNLCTAARGVSQIAGLGTHTSITGKHADIVVTDDIVNLSDRISRSERARTKTVYMELQNVVNRTGRFINTGTPWHKDDAMAAMPNIKWYSCYETGLISRGKLEDIRSGMTDSLFAANYELKHIADKNTMFTCPKFTSDESLIYDGLCHIEAAYGGGDATAFTVLKKTAEGYVGFGKRWEKHVDSCMSEIQQYHKKYQVGTILCEDNADKGYLCKEILARGLPAAVYHESMNKFIKISSYLKKEWDRISWLEGTDPEYINEILEYNEWALHDDSPDSAASLIRKCEEIYK